MNRAVTIPPPPPFPPQKEDEHIFRQCADEEELSSEQQIEKLFTSHWNYITDGRDDVKVFFLYNHVRSILQTGPTCGLVALTMAANLINQGNELYEMWPLLVKAQDEGYSMRGEMFSASNLAKLAETHFKVKTELKQNLKENVLHLIQHTSKGYPILIPYDADNNHEPCLRRGFRAHWATVLGFCLVITGPNYLQEEQTPKTCIKDAFNRNLIELKKESLPHTVLHAIETADYTKLFLIAKQGKSIHLKLFDFNQLCLSNCNLVDIDKEKFDKYQYVLPLNGLSEELCNKFLFVMPNSLS